MNHNETLGENLKRLRTNRKWSLGQLAAECGISKVVLAQIEKGEANPTVNTIWKIAAGLRVHYTELLDYKQENATVIHKSQALKQVENDGSYTSYSYYSASPDRGFDLFVIELLPQTSYTSTGHLSGSKEYVIINRGRARITVDNVFYILDEGDSFSFQVDIPHVYENIGDGLLNCTTLITYQ